VRPRARAAAAVLVAALALALGGCGFHLRGSLGGDRLPPQMAVTYIRAPDPYGALAVDLRRALQANGVRVTRKPAQAHAVLAVLQDSAGRRVLSVGPDGRPQEYELIYTVRVELLDPKGKVLRRLPPVERTRDFLFDEAAVLGMDREQQILFDDMRRDIVQDIVRRLALQ